MKPFAAAGALALILSPIAAAHAAPTTYVGTAADVKSHFLTVTGATQATTPYPDSGNHQYLGFTFGTVTFHAVQESSYTTGYLYLDPSSIRLPGNVISINAFEDLDVSFAAPVHSFGFDFHEPHFDPNVNAPFQDSTFTVTLLQGSTVVDSFTFNAPDDVAAFVGASSASLFDNVKIRETVGGVENEFFGQFYTTANLRTSGAPEPATWAMMLIGAGLSGASLRRRRAVPPVASV